MTLVPFAALLLGAMLCLQGCDQPIKPDPDGGEGDAGETASVPDSRRDSETGSPVDSDSSLRPDSDCDTGSDTGEAPGVSVWSGVTTHAEASNSGTEEPWDCYLVWSTEGSGAMPVDRCSCEGCVWAFEVNFSIDLAPSYDSNYDAGYGEEWDSCDDEFYFTMNLAWSPTLPAADPSRWYGSVWYSAAESDQWYPLFCREGYTCAYADEDPYGGGHLLVFWTGYVNNEREYWGHYDHYYWYRTDWWYSYAYVR